MARDTGLAGFAPEGTIQDAPAPVTRRRPLNSEDVLTASWNLEGATKHRGTGKPEDQLLSSEVLILKALWRAKPGTWREFTEAMLTSGITEAHEYWLCSAMLKLETNTVSGILDRRSNDPELFDRAGPVGKRLNAGISAGAVPVGPQG